MLPRQLPHCSRRRQQRRCWRSDLSSSVQRLAIRSVRLQNGNVRGRAYLVLGILGVLLLRCGFVGLARGGRRCRSLLGRRSCPVVCVGRRGCGCRGRRHRSLLGSSLNLLALLHSLRYHLAIHSRLPLLRVTLSVLLLLSGSHHLLRIHRAVEWLARV